MSQSVLKPELIFICGIGRSGTTLLQSILASHQAIAMMPETGFFRRYVVSARLEHLSRRHGWERAFEELQKDNRLRRLGFDLRQLFDSAFRAGGQCLDSNLYEEIVRTFGELKGTDLVGDKDPRMIEYIRELHGARPSARVVHLYRDPRDVLASKKAAEWSKNHSVLRHVLASAVQWHSAETDGVRLFGDAFAFVRYEDLITEPERELNKICRWIGIPYQNRMLDFRDSANELIADDEAQWKEEAKGPLLSSNFGKWRNSLQSSEVWLAETVNANILEYGRYALSSQKSSSHLVSTLARSGCRGLARTLVRGYLFIRRCRIRFGR